MKTGSASELQGVELVYGTYVDSLVWLGHFDLAYKRGRKIYRTDVVSVVPAPKKF